METTVVTLAAELCGADEDSVLLQALCDAAVEFWRRRLKGAPAEESGKGTLRCAAAFTAAADYLGKNCAGAESFTVGDVTVRGASGQSAMTLAGALRQSVPANAALSADAARAGRTGEAAGFSGAHGTEAAYDRDEAGR